MTGPWPTTNKVFSSREDLARHLESIRAGRRFVFTNGCFDILHVGHVTYLEQARELGDGLIVAVNSDASVRRLGKEPGRPINSQRDRCRILAALACVDLVLTFDEDTPRETLLIIRPDIHCKGGDYKPDTLPEADAVRSYGGRIVILPFVSGYSTTALLARAKSTPPGKKEFKPGSA